MRNIYSECQLCMFINGGDMTKCRSFLHDDDKADAKAIAIPRVFSENSRAYKQAMTYDEQARTNKSNHEQAEGRTDFWMNTAR